jgi:peptidyl-tRNA hydrolase, PTH1 family
MREPIRLVVGLGNPGREHEATRHNAGFWFVDALARSLGASLGQESRFHGAVAKAPSGVRLLKPSTYMNLSGRAVAAAANFFSIAPAAILVVHDELNLPPGEARLKLGGGVAGHNGLKDIRVQLGTADFWRLRLGIGHPRDSAIPQQPVVDYVLKPPLAGERRAIEDALARALAVWPPLATGDFERAMTTLHTNPSSPAPDAALRAKGQTGADS